MWIILTRTHLVLLSPSNVLRAVLCLPRIWAPQSVVLTTGPSHLLRVHRKVIVMGQVLQGQVQAQGHRLMLYRMPQILMFRRSHLLKVVSQVVLKNTVTVHLTLRLCG